MTQVQPSDTQAGQTDGAFTRDWVSTHTDGWRTFLMPFAGKPNACGIEIGAFEGRGSSWFLSEILTDPGARLICIDPFVAPAFYWNVGRFHPRVALINLRSQFALRDPELQPGTADFVYVDGCHYSAETLEDIVLSFPLLKVGGVLIADDYSMEEPEAPAAPTIAPELRHLDKPKVAIDAFLECYAGLYRPLHIGYQVVIEKIAPVGGGPAAMGLDDLPAQVEASAPYWREWLRGAVARPLARGLQFGAGSGRAASWFLENILTEPTSRLVCVDTEFGSAFRDATAAFADRIDRVDGHGQVAAQENLVRPAHSSEFVGAVDFVYIDGRHDAASVLEAALLSYRLLAPRGVLIFDDYLWDPLAGGAERFVADPKAGLAHTRGVRAAADCFLSAYAGRFRIIHQGHQLALEKLTD